VVSLRLRSKHWIVDEDDNMIMGAGRMEILETIAKTGSINQTAKIMKMSYKGVWGRIKATEKAMRIKIVDTDRSLGSSLTPEGQDLLKRYRQLKRECIKADDSLFGSIHPPLLSIVGKSGSGKTTLIEGLIPELREKALKVGTIKHHLHDFDMDHPGKDSWRHKQAGAGIAIISSPHRIGMVMDVDHDYGFDEMLPFFSNADIVISEGYKGRDRPKVEIFRPEVHDSPLCIGDENLIAMMTDTDMDPGVPCFALGDTKGLTSLLVRHFGIKKG